MTTKRFVREYANYEIRARRELLKRGITSVHEEKRMISIICKIENVLRMYENGMLLTSEAMKAIASADKYVEI